MAAACAGHETKVWNLASAQCFRSVQTSYGVCCTFAPGDKYVLLGCKSGELQVLDLAGAAVTSTVTGHTGAVWAMALLPSGNGIVTAGADKEVKFWDFEVAEDDGYESNGKGQHLGLSLARSVTMEDDVLSVTVTSNGKLLAMSLLDGTIRVVFADSLKFFLSLYGHRLPALTLDASSDCTLLVSGSADKNVKIWGLDFGDCHKSMLAHQDNVMAVKFVPRTHYFFSGGKDKMIKMWDADKFEMVYSFRAHYSEVWCLAVSRSGDILVSGSHDRAVRVWHRTQEQVFIEEERQREHDLLLDADDKAAPLPEGEESAAVGGGGRAVTDATDRLQEALLLCNRLEDKAVSELTRMEALGLRPNEYFLHVLKGMKRGELEAALLQLPLESALGLLSRASLALDASAAHSELLARTVVTLVRLHHGRLSSTPAHLLNAPAVTDSNGNRPLSLLDLVRDLRQKCKRRLQTETDVVGFNLAALRHVRQKLVN